MAGVGILYNDLYDSRAIDGIDEMRVSLREISMDLSLDPSGIFHWSARSARYGVGFRVPYLPLTH